MRKSDLSDNYSTIAGGKITFREPTSGGLDSGLASVDSLLSLADTALRENSDFSIWILLDRLDVAFIESQQLEHNALRALFRVYLDLLGFSNVRLKIFLRTDIWNRITAGGFREASHVTRAMTISWNKSSLLNLVVRRAIRNQTLQQFYEVSPADVLQTSETQDQFLYRLFPDQVDVGPNKPKSFDWMLTRTQDGTRQTAPRELIHLLNSLRDVQVRRLEVGDSAPEGEQLFVRGAFKDALPEVSQVRIQQTLYAEYPSLKEWLEKLRGAKTRQTVDTLASRWAVPVEKARDIAKQLVDIGFFEQQVSQDSSEFWVPFLYRDGLELVQGRAEDEENR